MVQNGLKDDQHGLGAKSGGGKKIWDMNRGQRAKWGPCDAKPCTCVKDFCLLTTVGDKRDIIRCAF